MKEKIKTTVKNLLAKAKVLVSKLFVDAKNIIKNHKLYSIIAAVIIVLVLVLIGMQNVSHHSKMNVISIRVIQKPC